MPTSPGKGRVAPMLATLGRLDTLGGDGGWTFEMKWDGVRAVVHVDQNHVGLLSRNEIDMAIAYPEIATVPGALSGRSAILDREIVSFDDQGRPSFRRLQKGMHVTDRTAAGRLATSDPAVLLLFDLLVLDGESLLDRPYTERRQRLEALDLHGTTWQSPPAYGGTGAEALAFSQEHGLEGIVA